MTVYIDITTEETLSADIGSSDVKITYLISNNKDLQGTEELINTAEFNELIISRSLIQVPSL